MNAIVTGGAGFIGSNLVEKLLEEEHEVSVLDDLSTGTLENLKAFRGRKKLTFIHGSITDRNLLTELLKGAECVFHQAAIPSVQKSVENPLVTNEVNVNGTLNVLVAGKECDVEKVVYASSCAVYGDTSELPIREDIKPDPKSPYAVSKLTGEQYCTTFSEVYGLKTVCLRYFNVYGPKQDPSSEYAAVIPRFITRVLANKPPIIYGDGTQTRDFIFVQDVVTANIQAAERGAGVLNIASGKSISINELADKIIEMAGKNLEPVYEPERPGEIKHSLASIARAEKELNYRPRFDLEKGLTETIGYFKPEV
ncbi:MAG: SDR family oxidoreductase [Methanophagales archaeon ANME-1-THS]|nr:MAG: SDR family oxidoreductase [Methanophagales archaeon ANME-1-THS]